MNALRTIFLPFIIFAVFPFAIAGRGEIDARQNVQANKAFGDRTFQNILKEAGEFLGNLTAAKTASAAADAKLTELKTALTQQSNKSSAAILLPAGWDKKSIVDALTKALSQNKQLQDLSDRFNRFTAEIKKLEEVEEKKSKDKVNETHQSKNKTKEPAFPVPPNLLVGNPSSLDNSTLMGKLVGFLKTGRHLGSIELSDLNPCTKISCDKWKKGLESLRNFLSKSSSKLSDLFKNSATLRRLSEEANENKKKPANATRHTNSTNEKSVTKDGPADYFDYYYNGEENIRKQPSTSTNHSDVKVSSQKKINVTIVNSKLTRANKVVDYFDYYYNQGVPSIILNRTTFIGGKIGG